jgi:metal-sulfur cluster biosynthetic enzyme
LVTKQDVMKALEKCIDPELGISLVDMGFIYGVSVKADQVHVKMTLSNPGCPMQRMMLADIERSVKSLDGVNKVEVELVWEPKWTPERISKKARKKIGFIM